MDLLPAFIITGMNNYMTDVFRSMERTICNELGHRIGSVISCMVWDFNCDSGFYAQVYMVVDTRVNYKDVDNVPSRIRSDVESVGGMSA